MKRPHVLMLATRARYTSVPWFIRDWAMAASQVADVTLGTPTVLSLHRLDAKRTADDPLWGLSIALRQLNIRPARVFAPLNVSYNASELGKAIRHLAASGRPIDCLHTHFYSSCAAPLRIAQSLRLPLVHTEHSSAIAQHLVSPHGRELLLEVCRVAHTVFAVSESLAEAMRDYGVNRPINVVNNPVDVAAFSGTDVTAIYPVHEKVKFISLGWLLPRKDYHTILQAFAKARNLLPEATIDIVGAGPLEAQLVELSRILGIRDHVRFLGARSRDEVVELLASSHVFVHASTCETFGVALVEAWATGLPVVTFDCGGVSTLADQVGGETVHPRTAEALAAAMVRQASRVSPEQRTATRATAVRQFDPNRVSQQLSESYRTASSARFSIPD